MNSTEIFLNALEEALPDFPRNNGIGPLSVTPAIHNLAVTGIRKAVKDTRSNFIHLPYEFCRYRPMARLIAVLYFQKVRPEAWRSGDWSTLAKIWHGGPRYHLKKRSIEESESFWQAVARHMEKVS